MSNTSLPDLGPQCLGHVFSLLTAQECGQLCVVSTLLRNPLLDDCVWEQHMQADFAQDEPKGPDNQMAESFRQAYTLWAATFQGELRQYVKRAVMAWRMIEDFLSAHLPEARPTLRPGATPLQIQQLEEQLDMQLPPALQVLYRIHDGQEIAFDEQHDQDLPDMPEAAFSSMLHGLFGGYQFYQHLTSVRMLPLSRVAQLQQKMRLRMGHCFGPLSKSHVLFAANAFDAGRYFKYFAAEEGRGNVRVVTQGQPMLAAPELEGVNDGVLRWFEEYARRLGCGYYPVMPLAENLHLSSDPCRGICLFPNCPPLMGSCVTRGVQVRASAVFIPEMSTCSSRSGSYTFAYSVRFSLLPPEQQLASWPATAGPWRCLDSCQLMARHWVVLDDKGERMEDREVRGEAVVGMYPLLRPGEPEFVYQSCTQQESLSGGMDGDFLFVEGSIQAPTGPEWEVICPRLNLVVPEYIF